MTTLMFATSSTVICSIPKNLDSKTSITINGTVFEVEADDLEKIKELGRGAYGVVEKMRHKPTETIMAVKVAFMCTRTCMCHILSG